MINRTRALLYRLPRYYSSNIKPFTYNEAEQWISQFNKDTLPKEHISLAFSRSSGPGGQNVNKVSTKVDMRLRLNDAYWIPDYAREKLKTRLNKSGELVITSDKSRTQNKNIQDCYEKLITIIKQAVTVQREADTEALARLEKRRQYEDGKRIDLKKRHSNKKTARRTKNNDY
ncbi:immature colon carcinoma transcript 1 protein precursor [Chlamydoabsidia padenii]|nr:immature colon carcinoma transcript 1 protein precursor [Chlamydoabsidia padenii]